MPFQKSIRDKSDGDDMEVAILCAARSLEDETRGGRQNCSCANLWHNNTQSLSRRT